MQFYIIFYVLMWFTSIIYFIILKKYFRDNLSNMQLFSF